MLAVGRDEVRHLDVAFHELANLSHQHVGGPGASLVLAEVLGPRLDDERLDEAIGVGEIAEQAPPLGAAATSISLDPGHRLGELALRRRRNAIGDRHEHRSVTGTRLECDDRFGRLGRSQVERVHVVQSPAPRRRRPRQQYGGRDQMGVQEAPRRDASPERAADGDAARQRDHVDPHPAGAHPPRQGALGRDVEGDRAGRPGAAGDDERRPDHPGRGRQADRDQCTGDDQRCNDDEVIDRRDIDARP